MRGLLGSIAASLLIAVSASATTYLVRPDGTGDFPTIQAAIDASIDGDDIQLGAGTFRGDGNRDVDYRGKAITIRSESGDPASVVIDCESPTGPNHRGFVFQSDEGPESVLEGVTVIHGQSYGWFPLCAGGAVMCRVGSPTIRDCVFEDNRSQDVEMTSVGGAVSCAGAASLIRCVFRDNHADEGGAIWGTFALVQDCVFCGNEARVDGGAVTLLYGEPSIIGCTIFGNSSPGAGGILAMRSPARIENTIIASNGAGSGLVPYEAGVTLRCCDLYGNAGGDWIDGIADQYGVNGNISADPRFCGPAVCDLTLHADSPCAPGGDCGLIGAGPVGCGDSPARETTWGGLKALFR